MLSIALVCSVLVAGFGIVQLLRPANAESDVNLVGLTHATQTPNVEITTLTDVAVTDATQLPDPDVPVQVTKTSIPVETLVSIFFQGYTNPNPPPPEVGQLANDLFGNDLPVEIEIGSIGVVSPVVPVGWGPTENGVAWDSPEDSVGFAVSSAAPSGQGNTILYAHNNVLGQVFKDLDQLEKGNLIVVRSLDGSVWEYVVEDVVVFDESAADIGLRRDRFATWFSQTESAQLTLMTCWPFTGNSHRVAVRASRVNA